MTGQALVFDIYICLNKQIPASAGIESVVKTGRRISGIMKKFIFTILVIFHLSILYSAEIFSGSNTAMSVFSSESTGRGGTGVSLTGGSGLFFMNPASIALNEKFSFDIQYGTLQGSFYNPDISFSLPTSYGTIGGAFKFIYNPDSSDLNYLSAFTFGGAKNIGGNFMLGGSLNLIWAQSGYDLFYAGATVGFIYRFEGTKSGIPAGLFEPSIGFSINAGVPIGRNISYIDFNSITLGYNFRFIKVKYFNLGFYNDFSVIHGYTGFALKAGLEAEIYRGIFLRTGAIFNLIPSVPDFADVTFGAGYKFKNEDFAVSINYSFIYYRDIKFVHYFGAGFEFGSFSGGLPEIEIVPDRKYFSPDNDGINDYIVFRINAVSKQPIAGWRFQISDSSGKVVKEYKKSDRDLSASVIGDFFSSLVSKKNSGTYPEKIIWDGTGRDGIILQEGRYDYSFLVWDDKGNISSAGNGSIVIDVTCPEIKVKSDTLTFMPDEANFIIFQNIKNSPGDKTYGVFKNSRGVAVKSFKWENPPDEKISWSGRDDSGNEAPEGVYSYNVFSEDEAGNRASAEIRQITLLKNSDRPDVAASEEFISYRKMKNLDFKFKTSYGEEVISWKLVVLNNLNKEIKKISGSGKLPPSVKWDCLDSKGEKLPDGEYNYYLACEFGGKVKLESFRRVILFDSNPLSLRLSHSPLLFSPDGDGEDDVLVLRPAADSRSGIKEWKITITSPFGEIFKTYKGTGALPEEIKWDGYGTGKELADPDSVYSAELEAVDRAGNKSVSKKDNIEIDILVLENENGFLMRLNSVDFKIESSVLNPGGIRVLKRVKQILDKYDKYKVMIEGHTDEAGDDTGNLYLSEERAGSVKNFLAESGINPERLSFRGLGETAPLYPNAGPDRRKSNKRIEILLYR